MIYRKLRYNLNVFEDCVDTCELVKFENEGVKIELTFHNYKHNRNKFKSILTVETYLNKFKVFFKNDFDIENTYNLIFFIYFKTKYIAEKINETETNWLSKKTIDEIIKEFNKINNDFLYNL